MRHVQCGIIALLGTLAFAHVQQSAPPAQIRVAPGDATIKISEPILIRITLTNTSDTQIRVIETNPDKEYRLTVRDDAGKPVSRSAYGKEMSDPQGPLDRNFAKVLQPKESSEMQLDLHKFFDFDGPGRYTVSVTRKVYKMEPHSGIEIASNELEFELER